MTTPTEPGFYWCKLKPRRRFVMHRIFNLGRINVMYNAEVTGPSVRLEHFVQDFPRCQWSERIERPTT